MKKYIHHDVFIAATLLIFCSMFLKTSSNFPELSGIFPQFFLFVLAALSTIVLFRGVKETIRINALRARGEGVTSDLTLARISLPIQGLSCILVYTIAIQYIGFFVSSMVFMMLFMVFLGIRKWQHIVFPTIGTGLFLYVLFVGQLKLSLPAGIFV